VLSTASLQQCAVTEVNRWSLCPNQNTEEEAHSTQFQGDHWSWKVPEFRKTIFQAWKVMENSKVMESHGK